MWARNSPEVGFGERETPKAREFFRLLRLRQAERRLDSPAHQTLPRASCYSKRLSQGLSGDTTISHPESL